MSASERDKMLNDLVIMFLENTAPDLLFKDMEEVRYFLEDLADTIESDLEQQVMINAEIERRKND